MDIPAIAAAAAIGFAAWSGRPELIGLAALMPWLVFRQQTRTAAFLVAAAYYGAANWPIVPGVLGFYGVEGSIPLGLTFWLSATLLQSLPWMLRSPLAYVASVLPPLGIIGWASPLTAAGILFPGMAWCGLAAIIFLPLVSLRITVALAIAANLLYPGDTEPPDNWEAINTEFGRIADPIVEFRAAESIQRQCHDSNNRVLVFPELIVPKWTESTEAFWDHAGTTALVGAGLPIPGSRRYDNVVLVPGPERRVFRQRIAVPIAMWKPFEDSGVPMRPFGPPILEIDGQRAAILICYEQLLAWPILHSALANPTLIVGLANNHWAKGTPIPAAQQAAVTAWARLFRLPKLLAVNT